MTRCTNCSHNPIPSVGLALLIPILSLCVILAGCWKEPGKYNWNTAPGAEQNERLMWQAIHDKEWKQVEYHLAPAFVGVNAAGQKFDRSGWVEYWKTNQVKDFSLGELTVQSDGPDMVVTYNLRLGAAPGSELCIVSVWQQLKKGWVLISQSGTPIK